MSDKPEKKPEAAAPAAAGAEKKDGHKAAGGGGMFSKTPVLMGIIMVIEAVILFAGFKFLAGGPKAAAGAEAAAEHEEGHDGHDGHGGGEGKAKPPEPKKKSAEVPVLELRSTNSVSGRTLLFDISICIRVKGENEEPVKQKIADNKGLITDRVRTIMAQSDPQKLGGGSEPGLETLRLEIKYQLDEILGEGIVEEVLVPRCIPFRADF